MLFRCFKSFWGRSGRPTLVRPLVILLLPLLAACGANLEQTVTLLPDEQWQAQMTIVFSGPAGVIASSMTQQMGQVETQLQQYVNEMEGLGVRVEVSSRQEDSSFGYDLNLSGQGLDRLNLAVFQNNAQFDAVIVDNQRQIHFSHAAGGDFIQLGQYSLTLEGGEVISSNGQDLGGGRVRWVNPHGRMQAVLTEKGNSLPLLLLVSGVLVLLGGTFLAARRPRASGRCAQCGSWLEAGIAYCDTCGHQR